MTTTLDTLTINLSVNQEKVGDSHNYGRFRRGVCVIDVFENCGYHIVISKKGATNSFEIIASDSGECSELCELLAYDRNGRLASELHRMYEGQKRNARDILSDSYLDEYRIENENSKKAREIMGRLSELMPIKL